MATVHSFDALVRVQVDRGRRVLRAVLHGEEDRAALALAEAKRATMGPQAKRPRNLPGLPLYRPTGALYSALTTRRVLTIFGVRHIIDAPGVRSAWAIIPGDRRPLAEEFWARVQHRYRDSIGIIEAALRREEAR